MKTKLFIIILILLAACIGAYILLKGQTFEIRIHESELQKTMDSKLPISKNYLLIFNVELSNPRVDLIDGTDRFNAGLNATLNIKVNYIEEPIGGSVDASGSIRYEPTTGQFFLVNPNVESLSLNGIPDKHLKKAEKVVTMALNDYYDDHPIYTLQATDMKKAAAKLVLKSVNVIDSHLVIKLGL